MEQGFATSPYVLPNAFPAPGEVLGQQIQNKRQDKVLAEQQAYRQQKDEEADQWRKLNLIQDLTDLSKHQTGSDVANAIGNERASAILQKYTQAAPAMSPNELMAKVQQDMSGLISGMDAMKNELTMSDERLKALKTSFPELNISAMAKEDRMDILNRRLKGDTFVNPLEVSPSVMNWEDPEFLSRYVEDDRNLVKAITEPKGTEQESVLMGKQGDYTKFEGKIPFWRRPSYDRSKFNEEGFYTQREIPSLLIKGSELPSDALPSSNGKPFKIIDKDVLDQFISDGNQRLSLIAATRRKFPGYDNFNPTEKEYAQRNTLYEKIETLDQSQLHPTQNVRPPVTRNYNRTTISMPGTGGGVEGMGNEFDNIDLSNPLGWGQEKISKSAVPANAIAALKAYGLDIKDVSEFRVEKNDNGMVERLIPLIKDEKGNVTEGSPIDRTAMRNAQLKVNSERAKDEQLTFGKKSEEQTGYSNITTMKDPSGNSIQAGVKNGKWYNIKTGKPL